MFKIMFLIIISNIILKKLSNCNKIVTMMKIIDKKNDNEKYKKTKKKKLVF